MDKTLIIAEAGVNHNGSLELAKKLALTAKECGADIVKYQTATLSSLVSKRASMAEYQKKNTGKDVAQIDLLEKLILSYEDFTKLAEYCKSIGIEFLSTPFDIESIRFLDELGCKFWKVPSGEITNLPYLEAIARTHKNVVMSTGMSTVEEIETALSVLEKNGAGTITVLHCTTDYPTPYSEVNLNVIGDFKKRFKYQIGYSDHTKGIEVPIAAVACGAKVIEKHFTLDRNMEGPDHKASLEPAELKVMVECIRNIEKAMGDGIKVPTKSELKNRDIARKSIIAKTNIKKGEMLTVDNITTKRPGNGISPMRWYDVLGTIAVRDFEEDELIEL